ncbi:unnamed protein product, partial [Ilex paraguariensis]
VETDDKDVDKAKSELLEDRVDGMEDAIYGESLVARRHLACNPKLRMRSKEKTSSIHDASCMEDLGDIFPSWHATLFGKY